MLKLLRMLLYAAGLVVVVFLAVANRQYVPVSFWPLPFIQEMPLYAVFLIGLFIGAFLGSTTVWLTHHRARVKARELERRTAAQRREEKQRRDAEEAQILEQGRQRTHPTGGTALAASSAH